MAATFGLTGPPVTSKEETSTTPRVVMDSSTATTPVNLPNPRKRPVAADLYPPAAEPCPKRPFGHSHQEQSLIIDISDNEDEDVAMELESRDDSISPTVTIRRASAIIAPTGPAHSGGVLKPFTPPPPAALAPPSHPRNSPHVNYAELQRKQSEIEAMRRKIADLELRKKGRLSRQNSSEVHTPHSSGVTSREPMDMSAESNGSSKQDSDVVGGGSTLQSPSRRRSSSEESSSRAKEVEVRQQKRARIAGALPNIDLAIRQKMQRLESMQKEYLRIDEAKARVDQARAEIAEKETRVKQETLRVEEEKARVEQERLRLEREQAEVERQRLRLQQEKLDTEQQMHQDMANRQYLANELEKLGRVADDRVLKQKAGSNGMCGLVFSFWIIGGANLLAGMDLDLQETQECPSPT